MSVILKPFHIFGQTNSDKFDCQSELNGFSSLANRTTPKFYLKSCWCLVCRSPNRFLNGLQLMGLHPTNGRGGGGGAGLHFDEAKHLVHHPGVIDGVPALLLGMFDPPHLCGDVHVTTSLFGLELSFDSREPLLTWQFECISVVLLTTSRNVLTFAINHHSCLRQQNHTCRRRHRSS